MLESILKSIKKSIFVAGLYAVTSACGSDTFGGSMGRDAGSDMPSPDAQVLCIDKDEDTFYAQPNCGTQVDCDDENNSVFPGAIEFCDYRDNNCDGQIDEGAGRTVYRDFDEDGFGNKNIIATSCFDYKDKPKGMLEGYVYNSNDCNDNNGGIYPNALEICDNIDQDCDGTIDNNLTRNVDCPIPTRQYTQGCNMGEWYDVDIESCPECLDGTREESCCGYDGLGTKQRFCDIGGVWFDDGDCSIDNWINVTNHSARDFQPSIDGDELVFTSDREGNRLQIFFENITESGGPISLSGTLANPSVTCDDFSSCDWLYHYCSNGSLNQGKAAFECVFVEEDVTVNQSFGGYVYVLDIPSNDLTSLRGYTPSLDGENVVLRTAGNSINKYNNSTGARIGNCGIGEDYPDISGDYVALESRRESDSLRRVYLCDISSVDGGFLGDVETGGVEMISGSGAGQDGYRPSIHENDIVFVSERGTGKQLYHYDRETGGAPVPITDCDDNYEPSVFDGKVAFTSERDGNKEVYVCNLRETSDCCVDAVNISSNIAEDYTPSMSTCKVAYVSDRAGNEEILIYDLCEGGCGE